MVFEVVGAESVLVPVAVVVVLFPGKLMTVGEVDEVDVLFRIPVVTTLVVTALVVTALVEVLRCDMIERFETS